MKIKYLDEESFKGVVFRKGEIFYCDRVQSEWSWIDFYGWRWAVVILPLFFGLLPGLLLIYLLFFRIKPWNRRIFINEYFVGWKGGSRPLFSGRAVTKLMKRDKVVGVEVRLRYGDITIRQKGGFFSPSTIGYINDVGRIEQLVSQLKKYHYPVSVVD